jgi:outer membrane protein
MKHLLHMALVTLFLTGFAGMKTATAQGQKIAHMNGSEILKKMDDFKIAQMKLDSIKAVLEKELGTMQDEYKRKYDDYLKIVNDPNVSDLIKETKEKELVSLKQRIEEFSASAEELMQKEGSKFLEPVTKKLKDAVAAVAKEKGYAYVLDDNQETGSNILYAADADDISAFVKLKLGIK